MTDWLLDTLLATSALMCLVLVIREPVRKRFGAGVAYGLWLLPVARLLMPTLTTTVERTVPAAAGHSITPSVSLGGMYQPYNMAMVEPTLFERIGGWEGLALYVWIAGATMMLFRGLVIYRRQRRAVLADATQVARLDNIRIVRSHEVRGPLAFGVFDRVIALPVDFDERFDERQRALALDHELAHHRAGDLVTNHLAYVLLCLQWFNPLAWVSHAAFRFDQEAACDARVLDRAGASDRAVYGRAIAKAASGRALLFSGALDRPSTLQRRLKSMLTNPTRDRRKAGKAMIIAGIAIALPLTATWATRYVDKVAPPAPVAAAVKLHAVAPVAPVATVAPLAAIAPVAPGKSISVKGDRIMIHGEEKEWEDLTPEERAEIRKSIAQARESLEKVEFPKMEREIAAAMAEVRGNKVVMEREMAQAKREIDEAMREIDAHKDEIRRSGQDPEAIKATVRASLASVEAIDVEAITRSALASVKPEVMRASVEAARAGLAATEAELDRLDRRTRK
jgi:bla regulator protein BlaR1